jgi:hypothetical protein
MSRWQLWIKIYENRIGLRRSRCRSVARNGAVVWSVVGFGPINGAGSSDMLMRNNNTGAFEVYDIVNNQITSAGPMGQVGLEWSVAGIAADPPGSAAAANSQLVQAMASYGSTSGTLDTAPSLSQPIVQPAPAAALTLPNNQNPPAG